MVGGGAVGGEVAQLIADLAESGHAATDAEIELLRRGVAQRGFDDNALERVGGRGRGIEWEGRVLRGSDRLPPADVHYIRHVLTGREWPDGTTVGEYLENIRQIVLSDSSGVFLSTYRGQQQLGFVGRSRDQQGQSGKPWILVDFRQETAHIQTAYQMVLDVLPQQPGRSAIRWLREPI